MLSEFVQSEKQKYPIEILILSYSTNVHFILFYLFIFFNKIVFSLSLKDQVGMGFIIPNILPTIGPISQLNVTIEMGLARIFCQPYM